MIKLVVGLGNHSLPSTRHSVGMSALNHLADQLGIKWSYDKKCLGFVANYQTEKYELMLLKPKLAMNINGKSIFRAVNLFRVPVENIILVQDDLDKPLGKIRVKLEGTASGHNGIKSTISALKTDKLKRYKIGIGRPVDQNQVVDYVLEEFDNVELLTVNQTLRECVNLLLREVQQTTT